MLTSLFLYHFMRAHAQMSQGSLTAAVALWNSRQSEFNADAKDHTPPWIVNHGDTPVQRVFKCVMTECKIERKSGDSTFKYMCGAECGLLGFDDDCPGAWGGACLSPFADAVIKEATSVEMTCAVSSVLVFLCCTCFRLTCTPLPCRQTLRMEATPVRLPSATV